MALTTGQVSDYKGAALLLNDLPQSPYLLADHGYDTTWFRQSLIARGMTPCMPSGRNRKITVSYDKELYKQRHKVEIMSGRLKDWRRIAMKYDRCAHTFFSAICFACSVIFSFNEGGLSLGEQLKKDPATISRWSNNHAQLSIETLDKIAEILDIDRRELLNKSK